MYSTARRHFGQGGMRRIKHTLVPLVFRSLALARAVREAELEVTPDLEHTTSPAPSLPLP